MHTPVITKLTAEDYRSMEYGITGMISQKMSSAANYTVSETDR